MSRHLRRDSGSAWPSQLTPPSMGPLVYEQVKDEALRVTACHAWSRASDLLCGLDGGGRHSPIGCAQLAQTFCNLGHSLPSQGETIAPDWALRGEELSVLFTGPHLSRLECQVELPKHGVRVTGQGSRSFLKYCRCLLFL